MMTLVQQLVELQIDKYAVVALLAITLAWALWFALKDIQWVYGVDGQYAKFRQRNINRISTANTAREFLEDMDAFVSERVDATRARSARLVLLGFAIPSIVLLLSVNIYSWLFQGQCPLQPGPCQPTLNDALVFVGWNFLEGLPSEILTVVGLADSSVETNSNNGILGFLALFVRFDAVAHLLALAYFELRVWQFRRANGEDRKKAQSIIHSTVSASLPAASNQQSESGPLQRAA